MVFYSLSIESPDDVMGDYDVVPAKFGQQHLEGVKRLEVVDGGHAAALSRLELRRMVNKKMVLIRTSKEKSDYEQCHTMQEAFAHGVLMCKESRDAPHEMQLPLGGKDKITIPCYCISKADGQSLSRAAQDGKVVAVLVSAVLDMWGCGSGVTGQLGLSKAESFTSVGVPRLIVQEKAIQSIACGSAHTLVLLDNGTLYAFGNNEDGQLGTGTFSATSAPVFLEQMAEQTLVKKIVCGAAHTCATGIKSGMYTWGANKYTQLGHSDGEERVADPTSISDFDGREVTCIAAGFFHSMAVALNHTLTDKEKADYKVLKSKQKQAAAMQKNGKNMDMGAMPGWLQKAVSSSSDNTEAKQEDRKNRFQLRIQNEEMEKKRKRVDNEVRTLYTWGDGGMGQLGHGEFYTEEYFDAHNPKTAVQKKREFTRLMKPRCVEYVMEACNAKGVGSVGVIRSLAAWGQQSAAVTSKGKVLTWGKGEYGRLGHGHERNANVPRLVTGFNDSVGQLGPGHDEPIISVAVGQFFMLALARSSNLYAWGRNVCGELGASHHPDKSILQEECKAIKFRTTPGVVKNASQRALSHICAGDTHAGGVSENGEVYIWGQDEGGRLGQRADLGHNPSIKWEVSTLLNPVGKGEEVGMMAMGSAHTMFLSTRCVHRDACIPFHYKYGLLLGIRLTIRLAFKQLQV